MLCNKTFAPQFCSLISNWFDTREQALGANLLHESVSGASSLVCTEICLPCKTREQQFCCTTYFFARNRWCRRGSFSPGACCRSGLREQAPSSCPSCVLAGVLTQERVSGACFRSKLPRVYRPLSYRVHMTSSAYTHGQFDDNSTNSRAHWLIFTVNKRTDT